MKLPLGDSAFAEKAACDARFLLHFVRQGQTDRNGKTAADNGISSIKPRFVIEKMHGTASTAAAPFLFSVHFRQNSTRGNAPYERMAMFAIGGHNGVLLSQRFQDADGHCLFSVIEVQKSAYLHGAVKFGAFFLQTPDANHGAQQVQCMIAVHRVRL